ncbi:hypothetical protein J437_LFUL001465 [Ladona fulva]|uniref:Tumor protein p53-inducible nuclear protein 1 n=1 Tax=Ladona fulva TaxID=123851 RepID=A0A8K0JUU5_LADFU|nr:hypothetical protein J437_LFUL001465 [Ladona fulva]
MFSNIANYLRGVSSQVQEEIVSINAEVGAAIDDTAVSEINAVDTEDDWVLVNTSDDKKKDESPDNLTMRVPPLPKHSHEVLHSLPPHGCHDPSERVGIHRSPSSSSLPSSLSFEESWFLTPPPCFTSTGPVHMETSSLENLLIEHPSMSVYQQRPTRPVDGGVANPGDQALPIEIIRCESVAEFGNEESEEVVLTGNMVVVVQSNEETSPNRGDELTVANRETTVAQRSSNTATSSRLVTQDQCLLQLRSAQKTQQKRAYQMLKRNHLDRSNKAREINSRNKIQRRSDRMQRHSGANNNRKC